MSKRQTFIFLIKNSLLTTFYANKYQIRANTTNTCQSKILSCLKVVQRIQRVYARHTADVEPQQNVSVVLGGVSHALAAQKEIRFEGPNYAGPGRGQDHHAHSASLFRACGHRQVFDVGLFHVYFEIAEETLAPEVSRPGRDKHEKKIITGLLTDNRCLRAKLISFDCDVYVCTCPCAPLCVRIGNDVPNHRYTYTVLQRTLPSCWI